MNMLHEHTTKNYNGTYEIGVIIDGKAYSYTLSSEYKVRTFSNLYRHNKGRALQILKKGDLCVQEKRI